MGEMASPYLEYFGFKEDPFNLTPNPLFFYLTKEHELAIDELERGVRERKGVVLLVGEMGTGKTILLRTLQKKLPVNVLVSYQLNPSLGFVSIVQKMLADFGFPCETDSKAGLISFCHEKLSELADRDVSGLLILDEAQSLGEEVLEDIRILSNIEDERGKFLNIFLAGQPELAERISTDSLRSLKHRIGVRIYLKPMGSEEISHYIDHRLKVAGWSGDEPLFTRNALRWFTFSSHGNPRIINVIADNALHHAHRENLRSIDKEVVKHTISSLEGREALGKQETKKFSLKRINPLHVTFLILLIVLLVYIPTRMKQRRERREERSRETAMVEDTLQPPVTKPETVFVSRSPISEEVPTAVSAGEGSGGTGLEQHDTEEEFPVAGTGPDEDVILDSLSPVEAVPSEIDTVAHANQVESGQAEAPPARQETPAEAEQLSMGEESGEGSGVRGRQIIVGADECLYRIILREYGVSDRKTLEAVLEANTDIKNPDRIYPGQRIFLPEIAGTD